MTEEGRKNIYVILAKNNERDLLEALLRRCSVIKLPPMPPVLAYKTLLRKFENVEHDPKFLKFICKVYEAIYNEQMDNEENLLSRLPALQELIMAITSDNELLKNGISSTRRINNLVRKLGKDMESRDIITNILIQKFKYKKQDSNYANETLDLDMDNPDDYMSTSTTDSLIEKYINQKDNGEYIFEEDKFDDPMKDIANLLNDMKDDQSLVFLNKENKEKIVELGVITHNDPRALDILFDKIKFKGNPNSRFGFLNYEGENFIGLMKYKNNLILISNKEYVSPRLLMQGLSTIITIIYDLNENINDEIYFSQTKAPHFKLTGLNAKILSNIPNFVLDKMTMQNGVHTYQTSNLKITYDDSLNISYFRYLQKYKAEPLYEAIEKICKFNPEIAIPASFINAKKGSYFENDMVCKYTEFENMKKNWESLKDEGWEVIIDDFQPINSLSSMTEDTFVFKWKIDQDIEYKRFHVYPKYCLNGDYLLYTSDIDFENDETIKRLTPFQKEIALVAKSIFGSFVPSIVNEQNYEYFSALTMSKTGRIVDDKNIRNRIQGIGLDITQEKDFVDYYDSISQPYAIITPEKVLKRGNMNG